MFWLAHNGVVGGETCPLRATHVGEAKLSCEIWIFTEIFFDPSPSWVAGKVEHWSKDHVDASCAGFGGNCSPGLLREVYVPRGGKIDGGGEHRARIKAV